MIIWLNGAFGSGKTTIAQRYQQETGAYLYDPEKLGGFLQGSLPEGDD